MRPHSSQGDATNPTEGRESVDHHGSGHAARSTKAVVVIAVAPSATTESRADYIRRIVDEAPPLSPQQCDQLARLMRPCGMAESFVASLEERKAS